MKKFRLASVLMLAVAVVFVAGCTKPDDSNDGGTLNGHTYVNLGLSSGTLWATCNVGAETSNDYGDYFSWGETATKDTYTTANYKWYEGDQRLTKYCYDSHLGYQGYTDNLTVLLPEDDAATANWGSGWYTPTADQWIELYEYTTHIWKKQDGVYGRLFTATNGNTIFLPAAGAYSNDGFWGVGDNGLYWSSSLDTASPRSAWYFHFVLGNNYQMRNGFDRTNGFCVRPVCSSR